jgi:hypothetical protein
MPELQLPNEVSKPWWQSRTIWGIAITVISAVAPKYGPIAEVVPDVISNVGIAVGSILAAIGRIKAKKEVTL